MNKLTTKTKSGIEKTVHTGDPMWDTLDGKRVRFSRMIDATTVEVASNETGKVLPDWRHITQLYAI